jgi:hypothetical protein
MTAKEQHEQRVRNTVIMKGILSQKYEVSVCDFDKTALQVFCTEKQFSSICAEYKCSGHYSDISNAAFITNFGVYK